MLYNCITVDIKSTNGYVLQSFQFQLILHAATSNMTLRIHFIGGVEKVLLL